MFPGVSTEIGISKSRVCSEGSQKDNLQAFEVANDPTFVIDETVSFWFPLQLHLKESPPLWDGETRVG